MARFLDTNILIRYLTNDDPAKSTRALSLLERLAEGDEEGVTTPLVIFETVFLLERSYKLPKADLRAKITAVLALQGLHLAEKSLCLRALDYYVDLNISYADAYNAAWMRQANVSEVYSWDREFDRIAALTRPEP
jgi:predicted nucleic acid-binding protein